MGLFVVEHEIPTRVWNKILKTNECWLWTGAQQKNGYGYTRWKIHGVWKNVRVHRLIYASIYGPISDEFEIDHLCKKRSCVNPKHLRMCTHPQNLLTRQHAGHVPWTHCKAGHLFNESSTYWAPNGSRSCRICRTENVRRQREKQSNSR